MEKEAEIYVARLVRGENYYIGDRRFVTGREYVVDCATANYLDGVENFTVTAVSAEPADAAEVA